jgi:hypothetical protein
MKDLFKQRVITIGIDKSTSKPHVVTRFIYVPVYYQEAEREAVRESMLPISTSDGLLLDWDYQQREQGIILSTRIAGAALNYESAISAWVRIRLNDQQLRDLVVDLVRAAMMRGIEFKGPRKWWQIWLRKRAAASG